MRPLISAIILICLTTSLAVGQTSHRRRTSHNHTKHTNTKPVPANPVNPANDNAVTLPGGLTYVITEHGTGAKLIPGQTVKVHYTGTLTNGFKFDSSQDHGQPIAFPLGKGQVIKGWDDAISQLHVGDSAVLVIPPVLAYGERGAGGIIPPNATLIFVIQVVEAQ